MRVPFGIILLLQGIAVVIVGNRLLTNLISLPPFSVEPVKWMPGIMLMWFVIASIIK